MPGFRIGTASGQTVFSHLLMDECGPFLTRQGRGRPAIKRWILVLTCGATRAVHLEVLQDKTGDSIVQALVRFACRHRVPTLVVADNAPEFDAAARALEAPHGAPHGGRDWSSVKWVHYPAYAPNFGGAVEAMVKLTKRAIRGIFGDKEYNDLELVNAVKLAEYVVNSRPLFPVSDHLDDQEVLTPNTFVRDLGRTSTLDAPLSEEALSKSSAHLRKGLETAWDELRKQLWQEHLPSHTSRSAVAKVAEGDVVIVGDVPPLPHRLVSLGKVVKLYAGADGIPRRADVLVRGKVYQRAVKSLAPFSVELEVIKN